MPLDPMLREVARMVLALPSAAGFALAGGGAMLEHGFVERPTVDLDLFASDVGLLARFRPRWLLRCRSWVTTRKWLGSRPRSCALSAVSRWATVRHRPRPGRSHSRSRSTRHRIRGTRRGVGCRQGARPLQSRFSTRPDRCPCAPATVHRRRYSPWRTKRTMDSTLARLLRHSGLRAVETTASSLHSVWPVAHDGLRKDARS